MCHEGHCDLAHPTGASGNADQCVECYRWLHNDGYNRAYGGSGAPLREGRFRVPLPCVHLGRETGETRHCPSCKNGTRIKLMACDRHGTCTTGRALPDVAFCLRCTDRQPIAPLSDVAIRGLPPGRSFNGSIAEWKGRTYLAYRKYWDRSRIMVVELGTDWQPIGAPHQLQLGKHPEDAAAQEDPRLFVHRDQLHVSYDGTCFRGGKLIASMCMASLDDKLRVESSRYLAFDGRQEWEKNWGLFDHEGDCYAVHTISPHRVLLTLNGRGAYELPGQPGTKIPGGAYGLLRGGAPPILHNGEYYSWFHGTTKQNWGAYSIGLYTFEAKPPFRPLRFVRTPLLWADASKRPGPHVADVVFPCGAIYRDGQWYVSYGHHDEEIRVASWDAEQIERLLEPLPQLSAPEQLG